MVFSLYPKLIRVGYFSIKELTGKVPDFINIGGECYRVHVRCRVRKLHYFACKPVHGTFFCELCLAELMYLFRVCEIIPTCINKGIKHERIDTAP